MSLPLHSVCIPSYNHERYILDCLNSVRRQTYPRLELIVVDDGSADQTFNLAEQFVAEHADRFERVELLRQANRGIAPTCNRLLDLARGEWFHLFGSDDMLYPEKIAAEWEACCRWKEPNLALVHADAELIDAEGNVVGPHCSSWKTEGPVARAFETLLLNNYIKTPTAMVRRDALVEMGGYAETFTIEDYFSWLKLSSKFRIGKINKVVCGYRWHGGNYSADKKEMLKATIAIHHKFIEEFGDNIDKNVLMKCYQKDVRRVWRWAKKENRSLLPVMTKKVLGSYFLRPDEENFKCLTDFLQMD
ncbi:glycosyltransferase [Geothermobacter hydrogeniphilus]|uniref:Glycosyltransferase 2-like domain-containing protein n=1 Tax=Geothermobacter hydrogeniphilus TaxID=1969733 RepID=A0A1X0Y1R2_9BACT|nr:glycosyltransferase [Geothermobacter hydrogeniphilus]ORJ59039.1 hypothetical protein B5V00_10730 [Geothermobacter hydrogeniphilus]